MSIRNAYRQGYRASEIGDDEGNPYKRMNKARDSYAWDRGFQDHKNGMIYQAPYSSDDLAGHVIISSEYETNTKPYPWKSK